MYYDYLRRTETTAKSAHWSKISGIVITFFFLIYFYLSFFLSFHRSIDPKTVQDFSQSFDYTTSLNQLPRCARQFAPGERTVIRADLRNQRRNSSLIGSLNHVSLAVCGWFPITQGFQQDEPATVSYVEAGNSHGRGAAFIVRSYFDERERPKVLAD